MAAPGLILFAEDDRRLRKLYTDTLMAAGYSVSYILPVLTGALCQTPLTI